MERPPKLILCFWPIFPFFKTRLLVQSLISLPNIKQIKRFMDQNLSWVIVNQKQFQFLKSKILLSCYTPINRESSSTHPGFNFRNIDDGYTLHQRITLSNCGPMGEFCGTHCHTVWYRQKVNLASISTSLVELGLKDLI